MNFLEEKLFETNAIKVVADDSAFWYTSGKIGPYFINTHFLFGNEKEANKLLQFINETKSNILPVLKNLVVRIVEFYNYN